jgi:hypothetical protein
VSLTNSNDAESSATCGPRTGAGQPVVQFISDGPRAGEPLPVSNYIMICH